MSAIETTAVELTPALLDLMEHEKVIDQGLAGFIEVGNALIAIRDGKKYRAAGYATFEAYCQQRWQISRAYGDRMMSAAVIAQQIEMSPIGDIPAPAREAQVRPLRPVPAEERAEVWAEAVEAADGAQPTAKQVEAVVARRNEPRTAVTVPKPTVADGIPPHPATYPIAVMDIFRELIPGGSRVLDPFAGVGTIHELRPECTTSGIEIEPEWAAASPHTLVGDSRVVMAGIPAGTFDVVATSPAYGNRLADAFYAATDAHARRSYALDLGRPLSDGSGAGCEFDTDGEYEELHEAVWSLAAKVLRPGGLLLLNCKDFQRDGKVVPVTGWHVATLAALGLSVIDLRTLPAAGLPFTSAKPLSELVVAFTKGGASACPSTAAAPRRRSARRSQPEAVQHERPHLRRRAGRPSLARRSTPIARGDAAGPVRPRRQRARGGRLARRRGRAHVPDGARHRARALRPRR